MKAKVVLIALIVCVISIDSFAAENPAKSKNLNKVLIIENLIKGINSDNEGLKSSATYFLGELKSSEAVIPLLKILKDDQSEETRIMAALSLSKIGDLRGIYAVKQAIKFDSSERVRKLCQGFYNDYLLKNK